MGSKRSWKGYRPVPHGRGGPQGGILGEMVPPSQGELERSIGRPAPRATAGVDVPGIAGGSGGGLDTTPPPVTFNNLRGADFGANDAWFSLPSTLSNALFDLGLNTTRFTLSFWLYQNGDASGNAVPNSGHVPYFGIGDRSAASGSRNISFLFLPSAGFGNTMGLGVTNNTLSGDDYTLQAINTPTPRTWNHHLVVVSGTAFLHAVNGVSQTVTGGGRDNNIITSTADFVIGAAAAGVNPQQMGIKNFAVYTNRAFGSGTAVEHYNSGMGVDLMEEGVTGADTISAYWRFSDEVGDTAATIVDQTGNGYDLTAGSGSDTVYFTGFSGLASGAAMQGQAAAQSGLEITTSAAQDVTNSGFTVFAWFQQPTNARQNSIFGRGQRGAGLGGWAFGHDWSSDTNIWFEYGDSMGQSTNDYVQFDTVTEKLGGRWNQLVGVVDPSASGNDRVRLYLNRRRQANLSTLGTMPNLSTLNNGILRVGRNVGFYVANNNSVIQYFRQVGLIRAVLTEQQIVDLFNFNQGHTPPDGSIIHVPFSPNDNVLGIVEANGLATALVGGAVMTDATGTGNPFE